MIREKRIILFKRHILVDSNGCWNYKSGVNKTTGYCNSSLNGQPMGAHRESYILFKGDILKELVVDHLCNNKQCVNPSHLEVKTQAEKLNRIPNLFGRTRQSLFCIICKTKFTYQHGQKRCIRCRDKYRTRIKLAKFLTNTNESMIKEHQKLKTIKIPTHMTSLFVKESEYKFGRSTFLSAVKLKLFSLGYISY